MHCQSGENLKQILNTKASDEQEHARNILIRKRRRNEKLLLANASDDSGTANILLSSLENIKREVRRNLLELERAGLVSSTNSYQIIVSRIAQDIRNQRKHRQRRQKELAHLSEVRRVLETKHASLQEQVTFYNEYVKGCLNDSLNAAKKG